MEPENGGVEDDFPFHLGAFFGSMFNFRGVSLMLKKQDHPILHEFCHFKSSFNFAM